MITGPNSADTRTPSGEHFTGTVGYKLPGVFDVQWEKDGVMCIPEGTRNTYYYCPVCGKIWGAIFFKQDGDWHPENWIEYQRRRCFDHGDGHLLRYSSLGPIEVERLPRSVMLYELTVFKFNPERSAA